VSVLTFLTLLFFQAASRFETWVQLPIAKCCATHFRLIVVSFLTRTSTTLSTREEHLIRPSATFSPSNAEKGNLTGEGQEGETSRRVVKKLRLGTSWE